MGFWGTFIVARADQPLPGLPALASSAGKIDAHGRGPEGWQGVQISNGPEGWATGPLPGAWENILRALMNQSGHPVIAGTILDSDCGQLIGYSPKAGRWSGWLDLKCCLEYMSNVNRGDEGTVSWDHDGQIHAIDEELTDEKRERYQRRYDETMARFLTIGPDAEGATRLAVTWALEAGLQPDHAAVLAALKRKEVFAERQFFSILDALGIPEMDDADGSR